MKGQIKENKTNKLIWSEEGTNTNESRLIKEFSGNGRGITNLLSSVETRRFLRSQEVNQEVVPESSMERKSKSKSK